MAHIGVRRRDVERFMSRFHVVVHEDGSSTEHDVTLSAADFERLGANFRAPEDLVHAAFEFLLEREPKESILPAFDVSVISSYFPEFDQRIQGL